MKCRFCSKNLTYTFLDLGFAPPSNAYLGAEDLSRPEKYFPLRVKVCDYCWLVQTEDYAEADQLFRDDYAYFSSTSSSWLKHASKYVEDIIREVGLSRESLVIEIASNDGYLLKNFVAAGIPCLGIEPTKSTADAAEQLGVPVVREFFGEVLGERLASENRKADLIIGNNVYAHVPDINSFTRGLKLALKPGGTITLEFPHLLQLIKFAQFDTVYHEHFSYLSLYTVERIFRAAGLRVWDVAKLDTHGGSLRVYGCHEGEDRKIRDAVHNCIVEESDAGLRELSTYDGFQARVDSIKDTFLAFLIESKSAGKTVAAYGAAAKGNTLLNYAGVKPDLLPFVCDMAVIKKGKFMPGSHIPIYSPKVLDQKPPDYLVILPWNIAEEIIRQYGSLARSGTRFVTAVPWLEVK